MAEEDLDFMQQSYRGAFSALTGVIGDRVILSGCVFSGINVSNGWICYNGEILPFIGGVLGLGGCLIEDVRESLLFQDGAQQEVLITRVARLGTPSTFIFGQLRRITPLREVWLPGDTKDIIVTPAYVAANFDANGIGLNERTGWALLDGQGGRVNAKGRNSVGYDPTKAAFDTPGETGGSEGSVVVKNNLPSIQLSVTIPTTATSQDTAGAGRLVLGNGPNDGTPGPTLKTETLGVGDPLSIIQPYYVTVKIIKL